MASVGHCGLLASRMSFKTMNRSKVNVFNIFAINNSPSYCFPWAQHGRGANLMILWPQGSLIVQLLHGSGVTAQSSVYAINLDISQLSFHKGTMFNFQSPLLFINGKLKVFNSPCEKPEGVQTAQPQNWLGELSKQLLFESVLKKLHLSSLSVTEIRTHLSGIPQLSAWLCEAAPVP